MMMILGSPGCSKTAHSALRTELRTDSSFRLLGWFFLPEVSFAVPAMAVFCPGPSTQKRPDWRSYPSQASRAWTNSMLPKPGLKHPICRCHHQTVYSGRATQSSWAAASWCPLRWGSSSGRSGRPLPVKRSSAMNRVMSTTRWYVCRTINRAGH